MKAHQLSTFTFIIFMGFSISSVAQDGFVEVGESMEEFISENHLEKVEHVVHRLASSQAFIDQFLDKERALHKDLDFKKGDVKIGEDVDIFVKHFSEHQNYTMILVPISIYSLAVYDTILFSVLEVSDHWMEREFQYNDYTNDSIKSSLLSLKNHSLLASHIYDQALREARSDMGEVKLELTESYISSNTIHESVKNLSHHEKSEFERHWGLLKKAFAHSIDLHIEMNVYIFGFDDLEVSCKSSKGLTNYKVTPSNIFTRHHFQE